MEKIGENRFFTDLFSLYIYLTKSILRGRKFLLDILSLSLFLPYFFPSFLFSLLFFPVGFLSLHINHSLFNGRPVSSPRHISRQQLALISLKLTSSQVIVTGDFSSVSLS